MSELLHYLGWQIVLVPLAALVVGIMAWRGMLGQRALNRGPARDLDLSRVESLVGTVLAGVTVLLLTTGPGMLTQLGLGRVLSEEQVAAVATVLQTLGLLGLIMVLMALLLRPAAVEAGYRKVGLVPRRPLRDVWVALLAIPAAVILATGVTILFMIIGQAIGLPAPLDLEAGHETLVELQQTQDLGTILGIFLFAAVAAPLIEELCFRGAMQTCLLALVGTERRWVALGTTAVLFGLIHYSAVTTWHTIPALIVLGLVFGYVYERTGSLLCCILVHAGFNVWNLSLVLLTRG